MNDKPYRHVLILSMALLLVIGCGQVSLFSKGLSTIMGLNLNPPTQKEFWSHLYQVAEEEEGKESVFSVLLSVDQYDLQLCDFWNNSRQLEQKCGLSLYGAKDSTWLLITGREKGDIKYSLAAGYIGVIITSNESSLKSFDINPFGNIIFRDVYVRKEGGKEILQVIGLDRSQINPIRICKFWYVENGELVPILCQSSETIRQKYDNDTISIIKTESNGLEIRPISSVEICIDQCGFFVCDNENINEILIQKEFAFQVQDDGTLRWSLEQKT